MVLFFATQGVTQMVVYHSLTTASAGGGIARRTAAPPGSTGSVATRRIALVAMTLGDIAGDLVRGGYAALTFVTPVLYLVGWLLIAVAIRAFARARVPTSDRESVLDAFAVVAAVALVLWRVLIDPALREQGAAAVPSASLVAFPIMQAALLAFYLRLLFAASARIGAAWVLTLAEASRACSETSRTSRSPSTARTRRAPGTTSSG
jgi:hypothetical protein